MSWRTALIIALALLAGALMETEDLKNAEKINEPVIYGYADPGQSSLGSDGR